MAKVRETIRVLRSLNLTNDQIVAVLEMSDERQPVEHAAVVPAAPTVAAPRKQGRPPGARNKKRRRRRTSSAVRDLNRAANAVAHTPHAAPVKNHLRGPAGQKVPISPRWVAQYKTEMGNRNLSMQDCVDAINSGAWVPPSKRAQAAKPPPPPKFDEFAIPEFNGETVSSVALDAALAAEEAAAGHE